MAALQPPWVDLGNGMAQNLETGVTIPSQSAIQTLKAQPAPSKWPMILGIGLVGALVYFSFKKR